MAFSVKQNFSAFHLFPRSVISQDRVSMSICKKLVFFKIEISDMFYKKYSIFCLLFTLTVLKEGLAKCSQGSYLNLCGHCVGGITGKSEFEGFDRCGICDGQSDCVGCDGNINNHRRDTCGKCLAPQSENWNDCRKIDKVYPSFIDLSLDRDTVSVTITGAGLKQSLLNSTQCFTEPLESQTDNPEIKEITSEENDIQLKIHLTESTGNYRIRCTDIEGFAQLAIADSRKLNTLKVNPEEVETDEIVQFELEIEDGKTGTTNEKYWCFVKTQSELFTFVAGRKTETTFTCDEYIPAEPGMAFIGIVANEEAAFYQNGKTAVITVRAKPPIPESAEYNFDMQYIVVYFDQNIRINECNGTFSPETESSLGQGFTCTATDNQLFINLGIEPKVIESLTIIGTNSIRRAGSVEMELSPNTDPSVVWVSRGKVMSPIFTLTVPSAVCPNEESQPVVKLTVSKLSNQRLNYKWTLLPTKELKGKNQRENMLAWKNIRAIEAELKTASVDDNTINLCRKNLLPGIKYSINLTLANSLQQLSRRNITATFQIQKTAMLSVAVRTFPSTSAIIAEADIILCRNEKQNIQRFRWMLDDKIISVDGKIFMVPDLNPGNYNVSCIVFDHHTNEILGAGWVVTQIVKVSKRVFIFPTEAVFGTMDDIVLLAYNEQFQFRWSCTTSHNEECIAVGPIPQRIDEIINMTTSTIKIPAGTLPVGRYLWTLHGIENATATVIISSTIPPKINIFPPLLKIDSTKPLSLTADVERLKKGCKIRWKTMHRKGYSYFNLDSVGLGDMIQIGEDDLITNEREATLVVPASGKNWKGLIGNEMYLFRLETICPEPTPEAHSDVTLLVNGPPSSSDIFIVPETGEALATIFNIQIAKGHDSIHDYPLIYSLSFEDEVNHEVFLIRSISPNFDTVLPPGNITLTVKTCDIWKSCSKSRKTVAVEELVNVSSEAAENLGQEIRNLILRGDEAEGYGKAIVAFKTLSRKADMKELLLKISFVTESAVKERIRDLSERLKSDLKPLKLCYEFLEQSVSSLKYFPETEKMVKLLKKFKNLISISSATKRSKREDCSEQGKPWISQSLTKATSKVHSRSYGNSNMASVPKEDAEKVRQTFGSQIDDSGVGLLGESLLYREEESTKRNIISQYFKGYVLPDIKYRSRRHSDNGLSDIIVNEGTVKAIFDLHAKILEQNSEKSNWEGFLADVRKYMIEICTYIQDFMKSPFLVESTMVTLEIKKLSQSDLKKERSVVGEPNARLKFNFKSLPRKTCAAIANYHKDFIRNASYPRVSDLYEVRIIKNGSYNNDNFKDDIKSMTLTIPVYSNVSLVDVKCMVWKNEAGWKEQCMLKAKTNSAVLCNCKDSGIFAAFSVNTTTENAVISKSVTPTVPTPTVPVTDNNINTTWITAEASISSTVIVVNATTSPIIRNLTTTYNHTEPNKDITVSTSQFTTTTTVQITTSKEGDILSSVIQNISDIRKNKSLHISGTFKINEDYNKVVGKNLTNFTRNLKMQIAEQLKISVKAIANIIVRPGSITVTVQFIDTRETSAEDAIKELVTKLHEGTLRLIWNNATVLNVPRQDLKVKIGSSLTRNTGRMRIITYGVVTGTCLAIFLFAVGATYFRRKRRRIPLILPHLSIDNHPSYRQFNNEISLDGSSASLARYRRDNPLETETVQ